MGVMMMMLLVADDGYEKDEDEVGNKIEIKCFWFTDKS